LTEEHFMSPKPSPAAPRPLKLSRIVLGMWRLAEWGLTVDALRGLIEHAIELGVTSFDHADLYGDYGCESLFGAVIKSSPSLRDRLELVTKCGIRIVSPRRPAHGRKSYDTSRAHIIASVENSLRALATDRIDLFLIHRPSPLMQGAEMAEAFSALHAAGKVDRFGVSNFTPAQFSMVDAAACAAGLPLVTNQVEFSPLHLAPMFDGTFDHAQELGCAPMLWSPLGGGRLFDANDAAAARVRAELARIGRDRDCGAVTIAVAWLLRLPCRPHPILGSHRPGTLDDALRAQTIALTDEDWFAVLAAAQGHDVP
jgi:predicted oxidoreductase